MADVPHCRLLLEADPHEGAWNMAVDEALLESAAAGGVATFRFYRWAQPTVSLGYFQSATDLRQIPRLATLPAVRRLSGGGAILHDHEWTYSCTLPKCLLHGRPTALYRLIHQQFVDVLARRGCPLAFRGDELDSGNTKPLLCFARSDPRDLVLGGCKVLGSAQRRRGGAVLQHGSLLLSRSEFAPQFPGLLDLQPRADLEGLIHELSQRLAGCLAARSVSGRLTAIEIERARGLEGQGCSLQRQRS